MAFQFSDTRSIASSLDPSIEVSGMDVTVKAMSFRWQGQDLALDDDEGATIQAGVGVIAYLVMDRADDSVHVLIDQIGAEDEPYLFELDGPYALLTRLFWGDVPADATDLTDVSFRARKVVQDTYEERSIATATVYVPPDELPEEAPSEPVDPLTLPGYRALMPNGGN